MMLVYLAGRASLLAMILITVFALLEWRLHNRFFALYARITVGLAAAYLLFYASHRWFFRDIFRIHFRGCPITGIRYIFCGSSTG